MPIEFIFNLIMSLKKGMHTGDKLLYKVWNQYMQYKYIMQPIR